MKKRANRRSEADDALCCCEYVNRQGERSHVAACCCDCEDLDEACDRWLKLQPQTQGSLDRLSAVVSDRLRVPWPWGGARRLDLSVVPPVVLLPALLRLAALHILLGVAVLTALPVLVLWINSCVGQGNHRSFLLTLLLFLSTSLYGIALVLRSVCPHQNVLTALLYCPGVYDQYSDALCFTCAWYCTMVTAGLLHLLLVQVLNVSRNVTEREARMAARDGRTAFPDTGGHSRGFRDNWVEFMTMGDHLKASSSPAPDLV